MSYQSGPPEQNLPAPRPESAPVPVERVGAAPSVHVADLTPERAAKIVRQSASARWVAFLAVVVLTLFVAAYYFYETGVPGVDNSSRLGKEIAAKTVTDVQRGYALFQLDCARCHGTQGEGLIGPKLNDQAKLLSHLTPTYLQNVLTVGGRYVCGDANSLMPVWSDQGNPPGPLNYRNLEELIAFIRATNDITFQGVDPTDSTKTVQVTGWRDPSFTMPAGATPVPACWKDAFLTPSSAPAASGAPSTAPSAGASVAPSAGTGATVQLQLTASNVQYDKTDLTSPANTPFQIVFTNNDAGIPHNVSIHKDSPTGDEVWKGELVTGVTTVTYDVPALPAGTYGFVCTVHPNMTGTLTVK